MASIENRKRNNGTIGFRVNWRDPDSRLKDSMTFDDLKEAERLKRFLNANGQRLANAVEVMTEIKKNVPTVTAVVEHHISHLTGVEFRTKRDYRSILKNHITPHLGGIPVTLIDKDRIRLWVNDIYAGVGTDWERLPSVEKVHADLETKSTVAVAEKYNVKIQTIRRIAGGAKAPMSSKTLHNIHALLSGALESAVERKLRTDNPCRGIRLPKLFRQEMTFLTVGEYQLLRSHIRLHYQIFLDFLAGTGIRWGEAIALTVGDIDLFAKPATVRISKAVKQAENGLYVGDPKTLTSVRTVSLPKLLVESLIPLVSRESDAPLFTAPRGGRIHYGKFRSEVFALAIEKAQATEDADGHPIPRAMRLLKHPGLHSLRHSHASWLLALGVDIKTVQQRLGHESITTTVDTYGHLQPDQLRKGAEAADAALRGLSELELVSAA